MRNDAGAVPAEHFSIEKRPEYRRYQAELNMFFPGSNRRTGKEL